MATLQKFKILATQCAIASSPTRSPTTSPVIHLRRRKTLRMLLGRGGGNHHQHRRFSRRNEEQLTDDDEEEEDYHQNSSNNNNNNKNENRRPPLPPHHQMNSRHKLKDLFVSSPSPPNTNAKRVDREEGKGLLLPPPPRRTQIRPLSATLRQRLLRRPWRPVLVGIPEISP